MKKVILVTEYNENDGEFGVYAFKTIEKANEFVTDDIQQRDEDYDTQEIQNREDLFSQVYADGHDYSFEEFSMDTELSDDATIYIVQEINMNDGDSSLTLHESLENAKDFIAFDIMDYEELDTEPEIVLIPNYRSYRASYATVETDSRKYVIHTDTVD